MSAAVRPVSVPAQLLRLALPVAGTNALVMGMGLVDAILVGNHSTSELAELALAWSLNSTALVATIGLLMGVQVLTARRMGEGRPQAVGAIWRRGVVTALVVGAVMGLVLHFGALWALEHLGQNAELARGAAATAAILAFSLAPNAVYQTCAKTLEGLSRPRAALAVMAGANVVNLGFGLWLVPIYGAEGAAWATLAARIFMMVAATGWLLTMPGAAAFGFLSPAPPVQAGEVGEQISIGAATAGSRVLEAGSFNALTIIGGAAGSAEVAAFTICLNVLATGFMPALGLASASAVLVSGARGAGRPEEGWRAIRWGMAASVVYGALFAVLVTVLAQPTAALFSNDAALVAVAAGLFWVLGIAALADFAQVLAADVLRAMGQPWFATVSHLVSYVCVMAPLGWYLALPMERGAQGLVEAIGVASFVSFGVLAARLFFTAKGREKALIQDRA